MHNANNSGTTGRVRRTLGFSGFLVVQTFNCQVAYINEEELARTIAHELNHARSWLKGGRAPEDLAKAAENALGS